MNILSEVKELLQPLGIPIETGVFKSTAPDTYIVLVPLADSFPISADDEPLTDNQELRITLFTKGNYLRIKHQITVRLLSQFIFVTDRRYNGYDTDAGYHQYTIDVVKNYEIETEEQ